jgi:hypothetical protein
MLQSHSEGTGAGGNPVTGGSQETECSAPPLAVLQCWLVPIPKESNEPIQTCAKKTHAPKMAAAPAREGESAGKVVVEQTAMHAAARDAAITPQGRCGVHETGLPGNGVLAKRKHAAASDSSEGVSRKMQQSNPAASEDAIGLPVVEPCCALLDSLGPACDSSEVISLQMAPAGKGVPSGC